MYNNGDRMTMIRGEGEKVGGCRCTAVRKGLADRIVGQNYDP